MKATMIGFALLMSGTAIAQTTTDTGTMTSPDTSTQTTTSSTTPDTTGQTATDMQSSSDMSASSSTMTDTSAPSSMTSTDMNNQSTIPMAASMTPASGSVIQPGNTNPEEDARGVTVMSDPATVPAGWNGIGGSAVGGPLVDPATGQAVAADASYPACSASVTDNCLQTYERGRSS